MLGACGESTRKANRVFAHRSTPRSDGQLPEQKDPPTTLIVLMAFDKGEDGEMLPVFEPREMPDERRAIQTAKEMSFRYAAVVTWKRSVRPEKGEFGEPEILFQTGDVPDLD